MKWITIKNICKWAWIAAILVFILLFVFKKKGMILQALSNLSLGILLCAGLLIFFAKFLLVSNMRQAAGRFSINLNWIDSYRVYNLTQLAKYIPGSIWQFVGRIAILRERGISARDIRDSLIAEHFWVTASAAVMAFVLILLSNPSSIIAKSLDAKLQLKLSLLLSVAAVILITVAIATIRSRRLWRWLSSLLPPVRVLPALFLTWILLGASYWITLLPFSESMPSIAYIIGVYCLAYLTGFLVPFAPAGVGIREAVLSFALLPFIGADMALILAAVNRFVYLAVEILAAIFCIRVSSI